MPQRVRVSHKSGQEPLRSLFECGLPFECSMANKIRPDIPDFCTGGLHQPSRSVLPGPPFLRWAESPANQQKTLASTAYPH